MSRFRRRAVVAALAVLIMPAWFGASTAAAPVAPIGTTTLAGSDRACDGPQTGPAGNVACGIWLVNQWLSLRRSRGVVAQTVAVAPGAFGVWRSSTTGGVCGFTPVLLGMHHCDRTTFVNFRLDRRLIEARDLAFTVLAHESAHGVQERRGKDPVAATLTNDVPAMLPLEQQADCWAGAALAWAVRRGHFGPQALPRARALFRSGGQAGSGHGSPEARDRQLTTGYANGPSACGMP